MSSPADAKAIADAYAKGGQAIKEMARLGQTIFS